MNKKVLHRKFNSGLRKIFVGINKGYTKVAVNITKALGYDRLNEDLLKTACQSYEKTSDYYAAYKIRPKTVDKMFLIEEENDIDAQIGIVMQGPLFLENHFTLETVKIYKELFPSAKVILSTWQNENKEELALIKKEKNCIVVLNEMPDDPGVINVNLQCITTMRGIEEAKNLGLKYVAKTRTDWRMYQKGALRFMTHLLDAFPCSNELPRIQNKRIITMDIATDETSIMFYPFWLSDIFQFGEIKDMETYWNQPMSKQGKMDKEGLNRFIRTNNYTWKRRVEEGLLIEARLAINYYERMFGEFPPIEVDTFWKFVKDYFMIVPRSLVGGYWYKYDSRRYNESEDWGTCYVGDTEQKLLTYNFDFVSWFNLINEDLDYPDKYKEMCNYRCYKY